jgi:magnesium-transporting ATPase (P-type)
MGIEETYEIIKFYDFTSERKMMSIAVKQVLEEGYGPVMVYSKGADTSIKEKCLNFFLEEDYMDFKQSNSFAS